MKTSQTVTQTSDITVAELIHQNVTELTPAERRAARSLLARYPWIGLEPLAMFARSAGVSHPTILRCIAKLGFSGYADFQAKLRAELEAQLASPLSKHREKQTARLPATGFLDDFSRSACENIRQSFASLPAEEFDGVVDLLAARANRVHLLGGRLTDPLASYLYNHLRILRPHVQHIVGPPISWAEYLLDMDRHTVLVVIDIRRYQDDVVQLAREAANRKAQVVLLTDRWLSPIAGVSKHVLAARVEVPSTWDSVAAMTVLAEALIAAVSDRTWDYLQGRIGDLERFRADIARAGGRGEFSNERILRNRLRREERG